MTLYYVRNLTRSTITLNADEGVVALHLEPEGDHGDRGSVPAHVASMAGFQRLMVADKIAVYSTPAYDTRLTEIAPAATGVAGGLAGATGTVAPAAGGAGALPATPKGYLELSINGQPAKLPYY